MSYKTILVHAGAGAQAEGYIRLAARLARAEAAHLVGIAPTGVSRFLPAASRAAFASQCAALRAEAERALARFERLAVREGVASLEARLVDDEAEAGLALQARYCDLAIVGQGNRGLATALLPADLPEYLFLTSGRPVLVVPPAQEPRDLGGGALVAWDGSVEAARAVDAALPLLRAARRTDVLGFGNESVHAGTSAHACAELAAWLGRHGVAAQCMPRPLGEDIGEALLSAAADTGAGLLVMGGYGHARFRELLLGGATATVLRSMTLPVLFAH